MEVNWMRVTPLSRLRGRILRSADYSLLCRTSALATDTTSCPRCESAALVDITTGKPFHRIGHH
ncbi:hypothetical protein ACIHDR_19030 [Nocardia sp. NPDC052278]|uniref:hypothetical protein n=1 Tax=unclassified Nocardia TaxID=2637762 RepID=UPI003698E4B2